MTLFGGYNAPTRRCATSPTRQPRAAPWSATSATRWRPCRCTSARRPSSRLEAGDLFSLNSMLGGSIEIQVVETLNRLRAVWDPDGAWAEYKFVRSAQTFPDVRLVTNNATLIAAGHGVAMGIELKGGTC